MVAINRCSSRKICIISGEARGTFTRRGSPGPTGVEESKCENGLNYRSDNRILNRLGRVCDPR